LHHHNQKHKISHTVKVSFSKSNYNLKIIILLNLGKYNFYFNSHLWRILHLVEVSFKEEDVHNDVSYLFVQSTFKNLSLIFFNRLLREMMKKYMKKFTINGVFVFGTK
jgi:hypothetical protein